MLPTVESALTRPAEAPTVPISFAADRIAWSSTVPRSKSGKKVDTAAAASGCHCMAKSISSNAF
jgi:hypothetical protein